MYLKLERRSPSAWFGQVCIGAQLVTQWPPVLFVKHKTPSGSGDKSSFTGSVLFCFAYKGFSTLSSSRSPSFCSSIFILLTSTCFRWCLEYQFSCLWCVFVREISSDVVVALFQLPLSDSMTGWGWAPADLSWVLLTEEVWEAKDVLALPGGRAGPLQARGWLQEGRSSLDFAMASPFLPQRSLWGFAACNNLQHLTRFPGYTLFC